MADQSARLALPFLAAGQAQKEVLHNEAIATLDLLVQARVEALGITAPPAEPTAGQAWIVGAGATGAWSGADGQMAGWTADGWSFVALADGAAVWVTAEGQTARRIGGSWVRVVNAAGFQVGGQQVIGPRAASIPAPSGGTTIDAEARDAIGRLLVMLKSHGLIGS